jgi:hypothetical protein
VAAVAHGGMTAAGAVPMGVIGMIGRRASRHRLLSFPCAGSVGPAVRPSAA